MQIILLERVQGLGQMGDVVDVKPGYARNFLFPKKKALSATKDNVAYFEGQRKVLEATNLNKRSEAESVAKKIEGITVSMIRQAGENGHLYGSVSNKDIADALVKSDVKISAAQVRLERPIKELGIFTAKAHLHPEVYITVYVNVAMTEEESKIQKERFDRSDSVLKYAKKDT